jgi:hypothetical protein
MSEQLVSDNQKQAPSAPYVSYLTFSNFLDWLREVDVPAQLDRTTWAHKFSGATGSQLMVTLRFLGLIDQKNVPNPDLEKLVKAEREERKPILRRHIERSYGALFSGIELSKATQGQLNERLKQSGIEGGTLEKALTFFVKAAKASDIELSTHLTKRRVKPVRAAGSRKRQQDQQDNTPATPLSLSSALKIENTLVRALIEQVPPGPVWAKADREKWFVTAKSIFDLVFKDEA